MIIDTIFAYMQEHNITIKELSNRCEIPYANLYNILHKKNKPRIDTVEKIANALGCHLQIVCEYDQTVEYYKRAALESRNSSDHWFRYLRKFITSDGCLLSESQITALLSSDTLNMFQKVTLKQALISGSYANQKVLGLNQKTQLKMVRLLKEKYHD